MKLYYLVIKTTHEGFRTIMSIHDTKSKGYKEVKALETLFPENGGLYALEIFAPENIIVIRNGQLRII